MARTLTAILALVLVLAGPARAQVDDEGVYRLQPGDVIAISVLEDPGLNQSVLVRPDGRISLPLAGTIEVEGLSPEEVSRAIRRNLAKDFVAPPTVTVSLSSSAEEADELTRVFVLGQVGNAGTYEVELPMDLLQLLAIAGGPSAFAATERIQLRRRVNGVDHVYLFDYEAIEDGLVPVASLMLQEGDVVVVPERGLFE
jgi:polysaccharide export outer membrane protein